MKKLLVATWFALCSLAATFAFEATVISATGKVETQKGDSWIPVTAGTTLAKGAVIQTGFKSELVLQIKESTVTVAPLSRLTIEQLAEKETKDETRLYLDTGSLKSNVKKAENRRVGFTVNSPVATASVRGTELTVTNNFGGTDVETLSGLVAVWKSNNSGATIATDEEDAAPEPIPQAGNAPQDVSDGNAPKGSFIVSAGQSAGFTQATAPSAPHEAAARTANDLRGAPTSAAVNEAVSLGAPPAPAGVGTFGGLFEGGHHDGNNGSVIITLQFPDSY